MANPLESVEQIYRAVNEVIVNEHERFGLEEKNWTLYVDDHPANNLPNNFDETFRFFCWRTPNAYI